MLALALALAPTAQAEHGRYVPQGLTGTVESQHFVLHYDPASVPPGGMTIAQYAQAGSGDFEEAYSRLVAGGGGTPNAGFSAPVADADSKTDVYLAAPTIWPDFSGGVVYDDDDHITPPALDPSYMFMTPDLDRAGFRFRAGHEFMHVIQHGYTDIGDVLREGTANWAAEFALPDTEPLDHNFYAESSPLTRPTPWIPLDCPVPDWDGRSCGGMYWTWLFFQAQTEDYGGDFVTGYYDRWRDSPNTSAQMLDAEIQEQSTAGGAGASNLARRFAEYARDIWDPTRWSTGSVATIHSTYGTPGAFEVNRWTPDTGTQNTTVDHLASRYVHVVNDGGFQPTGPSDAFRVTITRPAGLTTDGDFLVDIWGQQPLTNAQGPSVGPGTWSTTFPADPAVIQALVFPLVNDTMATDDLPFSYRVEYVPGPPAPPAYDTPAGAATATVGGTTTLDNTYAGGRGSDELPGTQCDAAIGDATRGVWLKLKAPTNGSYRFDATGSDFRPVIAVDDPKGNGLGCSAFGALSRNYAAGSNLSIYVGRLAGELGGRTVRLAITDSQQKAKKKCKKKKKKAKRRAASAGCKKKKKKKR